MRRLCICGSFRFGSQLEELESKLRKEKIKCQTSQRPEGRGILGCLTKIDDSDVVYIVDPEGYVGKSVSVDIGYAFARNKPIYVMHEVNDPPVMDLTKGILSPEELISFIKKDSRFSSKPRTR